MFFSVSLGETSTPIVATRTDIVKNMQYVGDESGSIQKYSTDEPHRDNGLGSNARTRKR